MAKRKRARAAEPKTTQRVILDLCVGKEALTVEKAKTLLGWEEETEQEKFGDKYLLKDTRKKKVRCSHNVTNRPLYKGHYEGLIQDILRGRWRFNGESLIIGNRDAILNGQHRLIALVLAGQLWEDEEDEGRYPWQAEPTIEVAIVYGVSEEDEVVNTMDTCKPRSLMDVIYRSPLFDFGDTQHGQNKRKACSRLASYAVQLLWARTGVKLDPYAPKPNLSEQLDFIDRHPKLIECVRYIYEENEEGKLNPICSPGYLSGMLYLMGSCETPLEEYQEAREETPLNWKAWDKACDFVTLLAHGADEVKPVRKALAKLVDPITGRVHRDFAQAVLARAWVAFYQKQKLTASVLKLNTEATEEGGLTLVEMPTVGGIDIGRPQDVEEEALTQEDQDEVESRTQEVRKRKRRGKALTPKMQGDDWSEGDVAWVNEGQGEEPYLATVTSDQIKRDDGKHLITVKDQDGNEWETLVDNLSMIKQTEPIETPVKSTKKKSAKGKASKFKTTKKKAPKKKAIKKKSGDLEVGQVWWAIPNGEPPYKGKIKGFPAADKVEVIVQQGFQGAGNTNTIPRRCLRKVQPKPAEIPAE